MLERITGLPRGVDGVRAVGTVSREDYAAVVEPLMNDARREGRRIRLVYEFGPAFERFSPGGAWEDARLGLGSMRLFEGCAVVTDVAWLRESARFAGFVLPCPLKVFGAAERDRAAAWLAALPGGGGVSHRLVPDLGVIVVEVTSALRAQDFDALAMTAETWIEARGRLQGLVIHARAFPGWENLGSFVRHVQFVRDHHRRIGRIALAVDAAVASVAPHVGEHFIDAEVRQFPYDELDRAIAWAAASDVRDTAPPR